MGQIISILLQAPQELTHFLGGEAPILSKIGLIIQEHNGEVKKRIILDTKQSGLKHCSSRHQRVFLPRLLDAITQGLNLLSIGGSGEGVDWLVLDFSDAFWQVPLDPPERRFFCARVKVNGTLKYVVFLRTVQGSRSAPLSWARVAALLMRLTQSAVDQDNVRLHCFVDDPISSVKGTARDRRVHVASMILLWEALGFQLSYNKGQFGRSVDWVGGRLDISEAGIRAEVKHTIVEDIVNALRKFDTQNVLSVKDVRSFVGRSNHAAGLLVTLRPFLQSIWAALSGPGNAPPNTIWKRQIQHALGWMKANFYDELPGLQRNFTLDEYLQKGLVIEIGTDASPYGMGDWLSEQGVITRYFACEVSEDDVNIYGLERGSCKGQQVLEALAILIRENPLS